MEDGNSLVALRESRSGRTGARLALSGGVGVRLEFPSETIPAVTPLSYQTHPPRSAPARLVRQKPDARIHRRNNRQRRATPVRGSYHGVPALGHLAGRVSLRATLPAAHHGRKPACSRHAFAVLASPGRRDAASPGRSARSGGVGSGRWNIGSRPLALFLSSALRYAGQGALPLRIEVGSATRH